MEFSLIFLGIFFDIVPVAVLDWSSASLKVAFIRLEYPSVCLLVAYARSFEDLLFPCCFIQDLLGFDVVDTCITGVSTV